MTDTDLIVAIRKIIRTPPRRGSIEARDAIQADLARYDQIVGLLRRHEHGDEDHA
jgi:hypothetical protein